MIISAGWGTHRADTLSKRFWWKVGLSYGVIYGAPFMAWYPWSNAKGWRLFDDGIEWKQMDKLGHVWTTYHLSRLYAELAQREGSHSTLALYVGAVLAWSLQGSVEIVDGFFPKWGASLWDLAANSAGSALFLLNHAMRTTPWQMMIRFSFFPSPYAKERPDALGRGIAQVLKDYNGQTYWLCLLHKKLPVGLAIGHSARGMIGGYHQEPPSIWKPREWRRWVLSLDVNWELLLKKPTLLRHILVAIKIPFPAFVYERARFRVAGVYF
ncbi:MAG: YfiM family protein [Bacteroidia bacterium]|nr:YfiM family protein [Bacteroidia bacterium]MDW8236497.1 DUF2279 domain-containing protein [Bacteroidia bacterium]